MLVHTEVPPLVSSPVAPGELCRRGVCTPRFAQLVTTTTVICAAVHVLFGWLSYTCWGRCKFPAANETAAYACLELPQADGSPAVALVREVFVDSILTAFFTCGAQPGE